MSANFATTIHAPRTSGTDLSLWKSGRLDDLASRIARSIKTGGPTQAGEVCYVTQDYLLSKQISAVDDFAKASVLLKTKSIATCISV